MESQSQEEIKNSLQNFQDEIFDLKMKEAENMKTVHFTQMDPYKLTSEDMFFWQKFKSDNLTNQEIINWRHSIATDKENRKDSDWLVQYIANKISGSLDVKAFFEEEAKRKKNNPSIFN